MKALLVGLMIALLVLPAQAQRMRGKQNAGPRQQQTEAQKKKKLEAEQAYKSALDRIPDKPQADPWGKVR